MSQFRKSRDRRFFLKQWNARKYFKRFECPMMFKTNLARNRRANKLFHIFLVKICDRILCYKPYGPKPYMDYSPANTREGIKTEVLLIIMKCPLSCKSSLAFPFHKLLSNFKVRTPTHVELI